MKAPGDNCPRPGFRGASREITLNCSSTMVDIAARRTYKYHHKNSGVNSGYVVRRVIGKINSRSVTGTAFCVQQPQIVANQCHSLLHACSGFESRGNYRAPKLWEHCEVVYMHLLSVTGALVSDCTDDLGARSDALCHFDGGNCCPSTCVSTTDTNCTVETRCWADPSLTISPRNTTCSTQQLHGDYRVHRKRFVLSVQQQCRLWVRRR